MTTWDDIYKDFQKGGEAWATLSEDIHPLFKQFLGQSNFIKKQVLDIGCGTGKYLKFLQKFGFKTDGIDSSELSIKMTKSILDEDYRIQFMNMFDYNIDKDKYDLIISISTIHHGKKDNIKKLVDKIHQALVANGRIFISVPDFECGYKWNTFNNHKELFPGTFAPMSGPERGLPHSFYTKVEVEKLFSKFSNVKMELDKIGRWIVQAIK